MARKVIFNLKNGGSSEPFLGAIDIYRTMSPYPINAGDVRVWSQEVRGTAVTVTLAESTSSWHYRAVLAPYVGATPAMFEFNVPAGDTDLTISESELVNNGS